jgi:hypothetical protein
MTWSARASSDGGIMRPSAFAVLRLMTSWYVAGCSMGSPAGLAPFRILSLVGRDSVAVSHALLERHAGHMVNEVDVKLAIAGDLGVGATRLFLVEQPGVFHLDMAMTLLAPGTVLMNDAVEAFRLQAQWLREDHERWRPRRTPTTPDGVYTHDLALWREAGETMERTIANLWKYTERFARAESRAMADLEGTGLRVLRVPGRFLHPARPWDRDAMNFLNGEAGTSARRGRGIPVITVALWSDETWPLVRSMERGRYRLGESMCHASSFTVASSSGHTRSSSQAIPYRSRVRLCRA